MGFLSGLFKRKEGGTFFGNLIRGAASNATGGLLGQGKDLAKWQSGQEQSDYEEALAKNQQLILQSQGYNDGVALSNDPANALKEFTQNSSEAQKFQNGQVTAWLKRNWLMVTIPLVSVVTVVIVLFKRK